MMMRWESVWPQMSPHSSPSLGHFRTFPRTPLETAGFMEELSSLGRSYEEEEEEESFLRQRTGRESLGFNNHTRAMLVL